MVTKCGNCGLTLTGQVCGNCGYPITVEVLTRQHNSDTIYHKPELRRLHHVSDRELVFLNFLRNQVHRCVNGGCVEVQLTIEAAQIKWQIVK